MSEGVQRVRAPGLKEMKQRGEKIAMLTAYDALMARLLERAGIDVLLVGDSVGMVLLGYETTLPVTLEAMIHHTRAVSRGAERALVVADMPFLTYQVSAVEALRNAGRLVQEGGHLGREAPETRSSANDDRVVLEEIAASAQKPDIRRNGEAFAATA